MKLSRFLRREKKEDAQKKTDLVEKKLEKELPRISEAEQKKYLGKHVAILGEEVVSSAKTAAKALSIAKRKHAGKKIAIMYVKNENLLIECKCLQKKIKS